MNIKKTSIIIGLAVILVFIVGGSFYFYKFYKIKNSQSENNFESSIDVVATSTNPVATIQLKKCETLPFNGPKLSPLNAVAALDVRSGANCEFEINQNIPHYRFHLVGDSKTNTVSKIEISKVGDSMITQTIEVSTWKEKIGSNAPYFYAQDLNFDGYADLVYMTKYWVYNYWLFDKDKNTFVANAELNSLSNPVFNSDTREIISRADDGMLGMSYTANTFRFINNTLTLVREEKQQWLKDRSYYLKTVKRLRNNKLEITSQSTLGEGSLGLFDQNEWVLVDAKTQGFGDNLKDAKLFFLTSGKRVGFSGVDGPDDPSLFAVDLIISKDNKVLYRFTPDGDPPYLVDSSSNDFCNYDCIGLADETGDGIPEVSFASGAQGASDWYIKTHTLHYNPKNNSFSEINVPGCSNSWHQACTTITLSNKAYTLVADAYSTPDTCHGCAHDHMYNLYRWSDDKNTFELWQAVQAPTGSESGEEALRRDMDFILARFITPTSPQKLFVSKDQCEKDTKGICFQENSKWTPTRLLPDLAIIGVKKPDNFQVGQAAIVTYTIKNIGHSIANGNWDLKIAETDPWSPINQPATVTIDQENSSCSKVNYVLNIGSECIVTAHVIFPTSSTYGSLKVDIDVSRIAESNSGNNTEYTYVNIQN